MLKKTYPTGETVYEDTLQNGLKLRIVTRPGFQRKCAYFVTDFGAAHRVFTVDGEQIEAPMGVAHFLEHKMFDLPDRDVMAEYSALGANPNAFTGNDMTAYHFSCTENFYPALKLLLEFVTTPCFTRESVAKEQGIIGQEIGMYRDSPDSRMFENLMNAMYRRHRIREPILGTVETIGTITPEILYRCHKAFYRPDNMLLCVVGDVDPEKVAAMAEALIPPPPGETVIKERIPAEEMRVETAFVSEKMEVAMPTFQIGFKCEPAGKGREAVRRELIGDLAAEALLGESSPLYLKLYQAGVIDGSFGGGFEVSEGMSLLTAYGDSREPETVRRAILEEAKRLCREGLDARDVLRMKRSSLGRRIRELDSFDGLCYRICAYHFSGFDYFTLPELYETVDAGDILEMLGRVVREDRCAMSIIMPTETEEGV